MDHHASRAEARSLVYFELWQIESRLEKNFYRYGQGGCGRSLIRSSSAPHHDEWLSIDLPNDRLPDRIERIRHALEESASMAFDELQQRLAGLDFSAIGRLLLATCHDIALYIGGSAVAGAFIGGVAGSFFGGLGALPGAVVGARVGVQMGGLVLSYFGLASLADTLSDAIPGALTRYHKGFATAWGPASPSDGQFNSNFLAAHDLADGHILMVTAVLASLAAYLTRGRGNRSEIIEAIRQSPKLGPKMADWVTLNEAKLIRHPALQSRNRASVGGAKMPQSEAVTPSQAKAKVVEEAEPRKTNKEKSLHGEARGREYMEKDLGMKRLTGEKRWNAPGIDDIYKNPKPPPDYVLAEYKYGGGQLGNTRDGLQMSDDWVHGVNTGNDRLKQAVNETEALKIRKAIDSGHVEKWLLRVDEPGNVKKLLLDVDGNVIRGN